MEKLTYIHLSPQHIIRMLGDFELRGPNRIHQCLVSEPLGPSIPDTIDELFVDTRLPGEHVKAVAKQSLLGLDVLRQQKICHGGRS